MNQSPNITTHVFVATSLDGFIARKDHRLDWLDKANTTTHDMGTTAFMAKIDAMIMGRGSFENMLKFAVWPYKFPVTLASRSMTNADIPADYQHRVRLTNQTPREILSQLASEGCKNIYVDGGQLVQSFIREGLIDELTLTQIPILLGSGISLFGPLNADIDLKLIRSQSYPLGIVQSIYHLPRT